MREGSNIHFSSDNKLLCSHSAKLCRQRRLNGYGFCVRHILEDPGAPFKQCGHVNVKNNRQQCTNAIPHNEPREYCNNHLIMLGLIPRKEKKPKPTPTPTPTASYALPDSAPSLPGSLPSTPGTPGAHLPGGAVDPFRAVFRHSLPSPLHDDFSQKLSASVDRATKTFAHTNGVRVHPNTSTSKVGAKMPNLNHAKKLNNHDPERSKPRLKIDVGRSMVDSDDPYAFPDEPNSPTVRVACTPPQGGASPFMSPSPAPSPARPSWSPSTPQRTPTWSPSAPVRTPTERPAWSPSAPVRTPLPSPGRPAFSPSTPRAPAPPRSPLPSTPERTMSAARLYPELAEKLYSKPGTKPLDPAKNSALKTALKSSRTMNALETKIAQNKIKDKIKRQENSLSGSDLQSPLSECSPTNSSPKMAPAFSPQSRSNGLYSLDSQYLGNGPLHVGLSAGTLMSAGRSPPLPSPPPQPMTSSRVPHHVLHHPHVSRPETKPVVRQTGPLYTDPSDRVRRLLRPSDVMTERQARHKFRDKPASDMYAHYSRRKMYNRNLSKLGIDSSESSDESDLDELPWQRTWFSPSSEDEEQESDSDGGLAIQRTTRQALMKTRLRRQFLQMHRTHAGNASSREYQAVSDAKLLDTARKPDVAASVLECMKTDNDGPKPRSHIKAPETRPCLANKGGSCERPALPFTNHCRKHIMYNVDQQLFDYCTGKNADNTQCCDPVFNVKYDFPLCAKHALIALRQAAEVTQTKKRKKTKPSALTRPPKRGRKKRAMQKTKMANQALRPSSPEDSQDDNEAPLEPGVEAMDDQDMMSETSQPRTTDLTPPVPVAATPPPGVPRVPPVTGTPLTCRVVPPPHSVHPGASRVPPTTMHTTVPQMTSQRMAPSTSRGGAAPSTSRGAPPAPTSREEGPGSPVPLNPVEKIAKDLAKIDRQLSTGARPFGHEPLPYNEPDLNTPFSTDTNVNLEHAARLLEEHDINEVLNKLPDEAFDIFAGKNGDYIPTHEETEELERALAAVSETVNRTKRTLDQMGFMDDPVEDDDDIITKQIADQILQQNMEPMNNGTTSSADDHLQDLANSISDHDLKTMSQAFSAYELESRLDPRGSQDLFGLSNGPGRTESSEQHQPIEWTSVASPSLPNLVPYQNGTYQNGVTTVGNNHLPQKLTQDLVALLANQLGPRGQASAPASGANGDQNSLVYQFSVSLPRSQTTTTQNKRGT